MIKNRLPLPTTILHPERLESKLCQFCGCNNTTRGDKDYCLDHVLKNAYAKHLVAELANRDYEDQQVRLKGSTEVNIQGITTQEILLELSQSGHRTIERITKDLNMDRHLIYSYAIALRREGKVKFYTSSRGSLVLGLIGQKEEVAVCA